MFAAAQEQRAADLARLATTLKVRSALRAAQWAGLARLRAEFAQQEGPARSAMAAVLAPQVVTWLAVLELRAADLARQAATLEVRSARRAAQRVGLARPGAEFAQPEEAARIAVAPVLGPQAGKWWVVLELWAADLALQAA